MANNKKQKNIPKGWSQILAGDIFSFVRTHAFSRENLTNGISSNGNVGNIHYGDIHSTYNSLKINLEDTPIPIVNDKNFSPSKEDLLIDGDLVMADASEDYEGVGITVLIDGLKDKMVVGGLHTFVLRDEKGATNKYYRQYIFRNPEVRNKLQKVANGVSVYGISKREVSKIILAIPSLEEQCDIVKILETWDEYLEKLSKKIKIKKDIKKGLMQKLLTGKVRLKGFNDEWEELRLSSICKKEDKTVRLSGDGLDFGKYPFFVNNTKDYNKYLEEYDFDGEYLIANTGGVAYFDYFNGKFACMSDCFVFSSSCNTQFLFYWLKLRKRLINHIGFAGSGIKHLDKKWFLKQKIELSKNPKEQQAIATILSTADQEIEVLEQKKKIIEDQKKYLLNNLITGKIRLPEFKKVK
ncbi:MAG: restriction endonuclease subunit S [Candidatus Pacebacteria bacterium]|nr:restriction endonuclease subunit S [Candidatus Paceibacterota bacterium]